MQTSIAQKQRDAQLKNAAPSVTFPTVGSRHRGPEGAPDPSLSRSGSNGGVSLGGEQEVARWKSAYETAVAENERLRSRGEEASQASQWRERFETCERERNEALDRLHSLLEPHKGSESGGGLTRGSGIVVGDQNYDAKRHDLLGPGAIYQRYLSLKEEFEVSSLIMHIYVVYRMKEGG